MSPIEPPTQPTHGHARGPRFRLCSAVASFAGFRLERENPSRHHVGQQILRWAADHGAVAVVLPAGFVRARTEERDDLLRALDPLLESAAALGISMTVGVDACTPNWEEHFPRDPIVSQGALPYFAVTTSTEGDAPQVFRQRSTTNGNWHLTPGRGNDEVHLTSAGTRKIGVVLSGEIFNVSVRRGLEAASPGIAVVPAHWASVGCRQWRVLAHMARLGIPVLRSAHAKGPAANVLWKGSAKVGSALVPGHFQAGMFSAVAHVFDV